MGCFESRELKKQKEILTNQNKELQNKIIKMEENIKEMKKEKKKLKNQIEKLSNSFDIINNYNNSLQTDKDNLEKQQSKLLKEHENLKKDNILLVIEVKSLKNKANEIENEKIKLENKNNELVQIDKERSEIEEYKKFLQNEKQKFLSDFYNNDNIEIKNLIKDKIDNILNKKANYLILEIDNIFNEYDLVDKINERMDLDINNAIKDFNEKTRHINIILLGKTGVGKSELINALKGKEVSKTGGFRPVTKENCWYEAKNLRLCDTQGYEISKKNNLDIVLQNIKNIIKKSKENKNPDEFIHCIWYCITGTRFEEDEENAIRSLLDIYEDKSMPIIIVYLRATSEEWVNNMKYGIEASFDKNILFIPILAKEVKSFNGNTQNKFGINELLIQTMHKIRNSIDSMTFVYVLHIIKSKVKENILLSKKPTIKYINLNLLDSIYTYYEEIVGKLTPYKKESIKNSIANLKLFCTGLDLNEKIDTYIKQFKKIINKKNKDKDNSKKIEYLIELDKVENEIKDILQKYIDNLIENYFNLNIFNIYVNKIQNAAESIVTKNLKGLKNIVVEKMQKAIDNNPNFQKLFAPTIK